MPTPRRARPAATALRYAEGSGAPEVVATGRGVIAERILAAAREAGIPVREDALLAEALAVLEVGSEIPQELYTAVAEALVWAYRLSGGAPTGAGAGTPVRRR
jgi:flagellar biosynthesis protein